MSQSPFSNNFISTARGTVCYVHDTAQFVIITFSENCFGLSFLVLQLIVLALRLAQCMQCFDHYVDLFLGID